MSFYKIFSVGFALALIANVAAAQDHGVQIGNAAGQQGESVAVSVDLVAEAGSGFTGYQWDILIDDASMFDSVTPQFPDPFNGGAMTDCAPPPAPNLLSPTRSITCGSVAPEAGDGANSIRLRYVLESTDLSELSDINVGQIMAGIGAAASPQTVPVEYRELPPQVQGGLNQSGSIEIVSGPPAELAVTLGPIDFGSVISPGTLGPEMVTVSNIGVVGAPDVNVSAVAISGADAGQFSITGGSCGAAPFAVPAGDDCTIALELAVNAVATFDGSLDITSDVGNAGVALTGEGTAGPVAAFTINPNVAAFGTVDLGDMPQSIVHTIENTGDAGSTLDLNNLAYTGDAEFSVTDNTCPASLGAAESCTVTVTFDAAANGNYTGDVDVETNVGEFNVPVSGEADSVAVLSVNPPFGPVNLGFASADSIITANGEFINTGSADGDVDCNITGPDAGIFSATPSMGTVPADGTVPFELACRIPAGAPDGTTYTADLNCSSPDDQNFEGTHNLSCGVQAFEFIPVPTMQPWALVLFSMLMLIAGGIGIRFFRAS